MTAYIAFITCALFPIIQLVCYFPSWEVILAELSGSKTIPVVGIYTAFILSCLQLFCIRVSLKYQLIIKGKFRVVSTCTGGTAVQFV